MEFLPTSPKTLQLLQTYRQQNTQARPPVLSFAKGQILQGIVTAGTGAGTYLLNIAEKEIPVQATANLKVGQQLDLQVAAVTPRIELQVIRDPVTKQIGTTIHLLDGRTPLPDQVARLLDTLPPDATRERAFQTLDSFLRITSFHQQSSPRPDGGLLQQAVERLGINLEQLLAGKQGAEAMKTLKFALLELSSRSDITEQQSAGINRLLQTMELFQLLHLRLHDEGLVFLPLPFPFLEQGYLLVEERENREKTAEKEESLAFCLHLRLEGLGNLRIEMQQKDGKLDIRFFTEGVDQTTFLRDRTEELRSLLSLVELNSVGFFNGVDEPNTGLLKQMIGDAAGVINTKA